jgi:cyclophilin family peptidyl-prolyl cis-trans isomerase
MKRFIWLLFIALLVTPAFAQKKQKDRFVLIITDSGDIKLRLYNETPLHRDNFLALVKQKYYDELLFHFIKPGSILEGGDPESYNATDSTVLGNGGPGYTLESEIVEGLFLKKGALVASRKNDKVNPNRLSNGSQFFIVHGRRFTVQELNIIERQKKDTLSEEQRNLYMTVGGLPALDGQYTVFGEVVEGMDVLDKLVSMPARSTGRPARDIKMWMRIVKK